MAASRVLYPPRGPGGHDLALHGATGQGINPFGTFGSKIGLCIIIIPFSVSDYHVLYDSNVQRTTAINTDTK